MRKFQQWDTRGPDSSGQFLGLTAPSCRCYSTIYMYIDLLYSHSLNKALNTIEVKNVDPRIKT